MSYQPIKFTWEQYTKLKQIIRRDFGNVNLTKGVFIITFLYSKYLPNHVKERYKRKYYTPFTNKKRGLYNKEW